MLFRPKFKNEKKIFVIGRNKTGTTSLGHALSAIGFKVGKQSKAEALMQDWRQRRFKNIVKYCRSAEAFQDVPFSLDYTYQVMDYEFPESKFILTVRDSAQDWYNSLTKFHTKIIGKGRLPTADDLKEFSYRETGWLWRNQQANYGIDESTLYNEEIYIRHYEMHNKRVKNYFKYRENDLLVINLAAPNSMKILCDFLDVPEYKGDMPHLNKGV